MAEEDKTVTYYKDMLCRPWIRRLERMMTKVAVNLGRSESYMTRYSPHYSYKFYYGFSTDKHKYSLFFDNSDDEEVGGYILSVCQDAKLAYYDSSYTEKEFLWDNGKIILVPEDFDRAIKDIYEQARKRAYNKHMNKFSF